MFKMGDKIFGNWEIKCSAIRRTKVWQKSPAAYRKLRSRKNYLQDIFEDQLNHRNFLFFVGFKCPLIFSVQLKF